MKKTILLAITCYCLTLMACLAAGDTAGAGPVKSIGISVETLGVLNYNTTTHGTSWGAGADLGVKLNQYVKGHVRLVALEQNDFRGSAIDEGAILIEGQLFRSANQKLAFSAIGGVERDFQGEGAWGLSGGGRLTYSLTKNLYALGEARARIFERGAFSVPLTFGLGFSF